MSRLLFRKSYELSNWPPSFLVWGNSLLTWGGERIYWG